MLIATDLDGTLVPNDSAALSSYTANVLARVDRAGIAVVFVTGRPTRWMEGFWPHVGKHGMAIVSNGAVACDVHARQPISVTGIEPGRGLDLVAAVTAAAPGTTFAIECLDGIRQDPDFVDPYRVPPGSPRDKLQDIWDVPAVKVLARHASMDPDEFRQRVVCAIGDQATATWSVAGLVEISAKGVTKASALVALCERLAVPSSEVVAFGDMPNDIAMLTWAGTSYAMANAHESVLAVADHIAPRCEDDGVAYVVEQMLAQFA